MDKLTEKFENHLNENYNTFKYKMISKSKEEIFNQAYQIHFYDCIYDYLSQYIWDETDEHRRRLKLLCSLKNVFSALWAVYIENEWLGYITWGEIDDLMSEFYRLVGDD